MKARKYPEQELSARLGQPDMGCNSRDWICQPLSVDGLFCRKNPLMTSRFVPLDLSRSGE
jgi:hypothetical protein